MGRLPTGELNALVDVPGVLVGHATLAGGAARTGVTAVRPHGDNLYARKVLGACHVINGYGKAAGLSQLEELGTIESPLLLTSTLSVGPVWEGGLQHVLKENPEAARDRDTVNVVVGECFDGWLSDARSLPVRAEHALEAIGAATANDAREGSVGAGTGTTCFGLKSGVGHASRRVDEHLLGGLVVPNYGGRRDLHLLLGPGAALEEAPEPPAPAGSIMVVLGTDAPLSERQLRRLAVRAGLGVARAGSIAASGSGEYVLAFSTAHRLAHRSEAARERFEFLRDDSGEMRRLFEAAGELVHEAVLNALCMGETTEGRDGHVAPALDYELLAAAPGVRTL